MNPMINDTSKSLAQAIQKLKGLYRESENTGLKEPIEILEEALDKILEK